MGAASIVSALFFFRITVTLRSSTSGEMCWACYGNQEFLFYLQWKEWSDHCFINSSFELFQSHSICLRFFDAPLQFIIILDTAIEQKSEGGHGQSSFSTRSPARRTQLVKSISHFHEQVVSHNHCRYIYDCCMQCLVTHPQSCLNQTMYTLYSMFIALWYGCLRSVCQKVAVEF